MADRKISDLTALTTPASGDYLPIVDISEASAANKNKRITIEELLRGAPDGTAGAPGIGFESDPNTGIYSPGADQLALSTNSTQRLLIDASGNVNIDSNTLYVDATNNRVGIGTSSPNTKLSVIGTATGLVNGAVRTNTTAATQSANSGLWLCGNQSTSHYNWLIASQFNVGGALEITPSTAVDGATFTTPTAVFTQTGRVGIGTTSPLFTLDVNGVIYTKGRGSTFGVLFDDWRIYNSTAPGALVFDNGSERARIDSSGRLLVGASSARSNFAGNTATPLVQIEGVTAATASSSVVRGAADATGPTFNLGKTRGASVGQHTVVASGDQCGVITFQGADGTNLIRAAQIAAEVDGTPGTNDMPGRLVFSVTADGASSPTEAMRIKNSRILNFANTPVYADNAAAKTGGLVDGDVYRKSDGTLMIVYT